MRLIDTFCSSSCCQLGVVASGADQVFPEFAHSKAVGVHQIAHRDALMHAPPGDLRHQNGALGRDWQGGGQKRGVPSLQLAL